jgi:hypothetical protein
MRYGVLIALLVAATSCAKNRESDESGAAGAARVGDTSRMHDSARIHDTTLTPKDTVNPADTMTHIRDSMPDSTRK